MRKIYLHKKFDSFRITAILLIQMIYKIIIIVKVVDY